MNPMTSDSSSHEIGFELQRNGWGRLAVVDAHGHLFEDVSVLPLFPITAARAWVSLVANDGREILTIEDLSKLPPSMQSELYQELNYRDFVPRISKVISVSGTSEPCEWQVLTNHGSTSFVLKSEEDIRRLSSFEVMIIDANGGRYRVDDTRQLDRRSRRFIEWYV
jgi:hypothetical protein